MQQSNINEMNLNAMPQTYSQYSSPNKPSASFAYARDGPAEGRTLYGLTKLKIPLIKFIYYTFLESEKISDEFMKYSEDFVKYINCESRRLELVRRMPENAVLPPELNEYFFENFIFMLNAYLRCFNKEVQSEQKGQNETAQLVNTALQGL